MSDLPLLSEDDGRELVRIARTTLREYALCAALPPGAPHRQALLAKQGAAVHLYLEDTLCGHAFILANDDALYHTVELATVQAGFFDPRFERFTDAEAKSAQISVSVLGPPEPTDLSDPAGLASIDLDVHAVLLRSGPCQAVLGPDEAKAFGWTREAMLARACHNAGLPEDAWKDRARKLDVARIHTQRFRSS